MRPLLFLLCFSACAVGEDFPKVYDSEKEGNGPMPAEEAAAKFRVPPGFKVQVFAAEPDVQNPIGCAWDPKGRLWVAENYTYAERQQRFDMSLRDRVLIFADKDGDGRFDERKVFLDTVQVLSSVEVGLGGVWLMCSPNLLFVPDRNHDDIPDGPAEVVLDGFTVGSDNYHTFANGLKFGPDGWLWGRCGASSPGRIGTPGTPDEKRVPLFGGIWRYHPRRKVFEVLCHGTTNPWGHDWNEHGDAFFVNTVNGHLWQVIPGAHFARPHSIDPNRHTYALIDQHADHYHWDTKKDWTDSRKVSGDHDKLGGGHAHIGCMIYQGDNWPAEYRGKLFTCNLHGRRINVDRLEREGSGYVGKHEPDFAFAADPWFRGMDLTSGPDGGVYILDWSDTGECHDSTGVHRRSGRIFKITYGAQPAMSVPDVSGFSWEKLGELLKHPNTWFARQATYVSIERLEQDRQLSSQVMRLVLNAHAPPPLPGGKVLGLERPIVWLEALLDVLRDGAPAKYRSEDSLVSGELDNVLSQRLDSETSNKRREGSVPEGTELMIAFPATRLKLASALQRLPLSERRSIAKRLVAHPEDNDDHNLPLMIWYGLIPLAETSPNQLVEIVQVCELSLVRRHIARRLAESIEKKPEPLGSLLEFASKEGTADYQADILKGLSEGLRGWRKAPKPAVWDAWAVALAKSDDAEVKKRTRELSIVFGDGRALEEVKALALDAKAEVEDRRAALQTLIDQKAPDLRDVCEKLLPVRYLNSTAVRGLALFDDPAIGEKLAKSYKSFHPIDRKAVIETLVSRPAFARALLGEIEAGKIAKTELSAFHARQIASLNNAALTGQLTKVWGQMRDTPEQKRAQMADWKKRLTPEELAQADLPRGRVVFQKTCAACHRLHGEGGTVGPDLTGSQRTNLDYLLENVVDPSAVVNADFRMSVVALKDGRVLNGLIRDETEKTFALWTAEDKKTLNRADVSEIRQSQLSVMPEDQLGTLTASKVRDLFGYLMHAAQVPLP